MQITTGEFQLIEHLRSLFDPLVPAGVEGIGDDCAIIGTRDKGRVTVVTTDLLCENVHFRLPTDGFQLGVRAVQVNLSDIAAMGARPSSLFLSIAIPAGVSDDFIKDFFRGVHSCSVPLLGGDTSRSSCSLFINLTAMGSAPMANIKRRRDAKVGDVILVAGKLGAQAASGYTAPVTAQCEQGAWLGTRSEVHAMMDLSDGLAGDLPHILAASEVGARVELSSIPIATGATLEQAISGGEDFVLLLTCNACRAVELQADFEAQFSTTLFNIGVITAPPTQIEWLSNGTPTSISPTGFRHF